MKKRNRRFRVVHFDMDEYLNEKQEKSNMPQEIKEKLNFAKIIIAVCFPLGIAVGSFFNWQLNILIAVLLGIGLYCFLFFTLKKDWKLCTGSVVCLAAGIIIGYFFIPFFISDIISVKELIQHGRT
nr:hypothetical protein [uncultured Treponema sp.]